jgi:hypothetical protein
MRLFHRVLVGGSMKVNRSRRAFTAALSVAAALLASSAQAYTPEQQQACTGDAFRLCGSEIPSIDRVTVCMMRNRALLSPGCRVYFRPQEAVARPDMRARRSARIAPSTVRHPATMKPRKSKKPARAAGAT